MFNEMIDAGIFGGLTALISFALAFVVLKIFKVKSPFSSKVFYYVFGVVTFLVYMGFMALGLLK